MDESHARNDGDGRGLPRSGGAREGRAPTVHGKDRKFNPAAIPVCLAGAPGASAKEVAECAQWALC